MDSESTCTERVHDQYEGHDTCQGQVGHVHGHRGDRDDGPGCLFTGELVMRKP